MHTSANFCQFDDSVLYLIWIWFYNNVTVESTHSNSIFACHYLLNCQHILSCFPHQVSLGELSSALTILSSWTWNHFFTSYLWPLSWKPLKQACHNPEIGEAWIQFAKKHYHRPMAIFEGNLFSVLFCICTKVCEFWTWKLWRGERLEPVWSEKAANNKI